MFEFNLPTSTCRPSISEVISFGLCEEIDFNHNPNAKDMAKYVELCNTVSLR